MKKIKFVDLSILWVLPILSSIVYADDVTKYCFKLEIDTILTAEGAMYSPEIVKDKVCIEVKGDIIDPLLGVNQLEKKWAYLAKRGDTNYYTQQICEYQSEQWHCAPPAIKFNYHCQTYEDNKRSCGSTDSALFYFERGQAKYELSEQNSGTREERRKALREAIKDYTEAIRINPEYAEAYFERGQVQEKFAYGRSIKYFIEVIREAIKDYTEAIRINPEYAAAYFERGKALWQFKIYIKSIKDYTEAFRESIKDFSEVIRINPEYAAAYFERGRAKKTLGQTTEAIKDFSEAIRINPEDAEAYGRRGGAKNELGQTAEAIKDYTEAIRIDPKRVWYYTERADAKQALGQYAEAIKDYTEVIRLEPRGGYTDYAYKGRADALEKLGKNDAAKKDRAKYKKLLTDPYIKIY